LSLPPTDRFPLEPSLWFATAAAAPATAPLTEALDGSLSVDVLIIGAGYAGLSTALHLAELGHKPVVVEAKSIGFGGSGRNGGQLVPGLKWDPDDLVSKFGAAAGEKVVAFAGATTRSVYDLIDNYKLDVPQVRNGWIQPAHSQVGLKRAESRVRQWARWGADVRMLSKAEVRDLVGTDKYLGGWLDARGGAVQPLSYAREMARAALGLGARIFTDTPVDEISRGPQGWLVRTGNGPVISARSVVVCANAYGGALWPGLKQSIVDANTYQVATAKLPREVLDSILPQGQVASDTRNLLFYFRKDHTGRFIMGGRGPFREPTSNADWAHLERAAIRMFPQLGGCAWEFRWCGRVAITRDYYPHLHEPAPDLLIDIGCQGRGVGLQTSMGAAIARYVHTRDKSQLPFPLSDIKPLPLHALRRLYVSAVVSWYRLNDGL
jgi:glycine/D-amino acid oxidase-like deaminating enzyme